MRVTNADAIQENFDELIRQANKMNPATEKEACAIRDAKIVTGYIMKAVVQSVPTFELIHCKDCKYCNKVNYYSTENELYVTLYHCERHGKELMHPTDFCSRGEMEERDSGNVG